MNIEEPAPNTQQDHIRELHDINQRLRDELSRLNAHLVNKNEALRLASDYVKLSSDVRETGLGRLVYIKLMEAMLNGPPSTMP